MSVVLERQHYLWELDARPEILVDIRSVVREAVWALACPNPREQRERAVCLAPVCEDVVLLVSELASNVLLHCRDRRCAVSVSLTSDGRALRVGVRDYERRVPELRRPTEFQEHGRGLQVINDLAERWGWVRRPDGKEVWCEVSLAGRAE